MRRDVILSPEAIEDLEAIYESLVGRFGQRIASRSVDRLVAYCFSFELFPERGAKVDEQRPDLRLVGYRRHATIAFRIQDFEVTILRVYPAGMDIRFDIESF